MLDARRNADEAKHLAKKAATSPGMKALARFGYASKGLVYLIIGGLAAELAAGSPSSQTPDRNGAIHLIAGEPFGKALLGLIAFGFFGYALWTAIQAVVDPEHKGTKPKALVERIGHAVVACSYGALAVGALLLIIGSSNGKDSNASTQSWTARLLDAPFGVALVVIVGLVILGVACVLFYRVYKADFSQSLNLARLRSGLRRVVVWLGRFGYASQAVVFAIIGLFLIVAALQHNPGQAKGLDGALQELTQQPFGQALLALVALGFIAFGVYSLVEARYRRLGNA